jgi:GAF domain-containing protein
MGKGQGSMVGGDAMNEGERESRLNNAFVALADTLVADFDIVGLLDRLVRECAGLLDVDAGGLLLADASGSLHLVASTSERADVVELMQLNAGEGPCLECYALGQPVNVADIDANGSRWPQFRSAALDQGYRAVFTTPMKLRDTVIGAMNLFRATTGELNDRDVAAARALTAVATIGILQERMIRESGIVAEQLQRALDSRILIEQAKGVLAQAGSLDFDQAFIALRDYARSHQLSLRTVAEGVTARRLNVLEGRTVPPTT